jgi:hypothetical protein
MNVTLCEGRDCASEGFLSQATGALYCEDCGKPDMHQAMVRLQKALKRGDSVETATIYAVLASRTWRAACGEFEGQR